MGFDGYVEHLPPESIFTDVPLWAIIALLLIVVAAITASVTVCIKQKKRKNQPVVNYQKDVLIKSPAVADRNSCINKSLL